jgi:uncharacterized protein (TIGR02246 family)
MENQGRDEATIRALVNTWHRSTCAGDVARVLTFIAEDAVFLTAGAPPMKGREAFAQSLRHLLETHEIESRGEVREVRTSGDLAYCWTDLLVAVKPILGGGEPKVRKGPSLSIFRRQPDGDWVLLRDANMLTPDSAELELKVDNLERELMADGPGGD